MAKPSVQQFYFSIQLSQQQFLRYYQGTANAVQVVSECGRRLQFPAAKLRPFLGHAGICGRFRLTVDEHNRFLRLQQTN